MEILEKKEVLKKVKWDRTRATSVLERKAGTMTAEQILTAEAEIESYLEIITSLEEAIDKATSELGFTETLKGSLRKFKGDTFLCLRMNMLALHERIVQNSIARRFEMEKLERLVRYGDRMGKYLCPPFPHFFDILEQHTAITLRSSKLLIDAKVVTAD
jgi:hypothetical protein